MGYEDFVWFILSEDKSSKPSLEYWFKCVDLDGDGIITPNKMEYFYEEQLHRMECMAQEPVLFEDPVQSWCWVVSGFDTRLRSSMEKEAQGKEAAEVEDVMRNDPDVVTSLPQKRRESTVSHSEAHQGSSTCGTVSSSSTSHESLESVTARLDKAMEKVSETGLALWEAKRELATVRGEATPPDVKYQNESGALWKLHMAQEADFKQAKEYFAIAAVYDCHIDRYGGQYILPDPFDSCAPNAFDPFTSSPFDPGNVRGRNRRRCLM